ncbi:MAG: DUF3341 domain-containing protein [Saprospiraceae bacterium]|uniref:DUF3341 domain-containing protein n=1 Tax=Candidatus Defluviibacterium haderslevense TaxID=2981993 RepID=A0A9D7SA08_9BACT|nr:DUF3341 domain-containing protein [Candidatus Defluviibacterium haderslevense]
MDQALGLSESWIALCRFCIWHDRNFNCFPGYELDIYERLADHFGGKPHWPVPAFIPITFELTVLFAAWGMTITFYTICGLWPGVSNPQLDLRTTDDKFCIAFDKAEVSESDAKIFP